MELPTPDDQEKEYWELIYNYKQICEALVHEGSLVSKALFRSKIQRILDICQPPLSEETIYILLTSLNRGLYIYLLIELDLSFTECCYQNRVHNYNIVDVDSLLDAGSRIIDAYAACLESSRSNQTQINKVLAYINTHLGDDLSLNAVSAGVYISKSHLCSIFKSLMGMTFTDYVRQQRIRHARLLLTTTDRSIDDIASACGFNSSTYFSTVFRSEMGLAPSTFRRELCAADR